MALSPSGLEVHQKISTELRANCLHLDDTPSFYIFLSLWPAQLGTCRLRLKCDGTRAETIFRLSATRMSPFKSAGASVHSTTGSRVVRISDVSAGYTMFRGSVKGTGYPFHSPISHWLPLPCVTVCHHISTGLCQLHYGLDDCGVWVRFAAGARDCPSMNIFQGTTLPSIQWSFERFPSPVPTLRASLVQRLRTRRAVRLFPHTAS